MTDPRQLPQLEHLERVQGTAGKTTTRQVCVPVANLCRTPNGPRDRQVIFGESFETFGTTDGWTYGRTTNTGYIGFVPSDALSDPPPQTTQLRVKTQWATLYSTPDFKGPDQLTVPCGSILSGTGTTGTFWETAHGFVPMQQVTSELAKDPAAVALGFVGTPYLWGGNSSSGIDCSGLVQAAYLACGMPCPGDSDLMERELNGAVPDQAGRNQLYFWKGHVAITISDTHIVHANAHAMAVTIENTNDAINRIQAAGDGPVTRRLQIAI